MLDGDTELATVHRGSRGASLHSDSRVGSAGNSDLNVFSNPTAADNIVEDGSPAHEFSLPPVDSGKDAWLFLAACFIMEALIWGFPFAYGVFQEYYSTHPPFAGSGNIAVIGTCAMGIMYISAPLVFGTLQRWPKVQRWSTAGGVLVMSLALAMSSFSTSTTHLIVTQGVLYAVGGSFAYSPCIMFMDEWFVKKIGLAYGIMWAGTGLAGIVVPILLQWILDSYGYRAALRSWSICLFVLTAPLLRFIKRRVPISQVHQTRRFDFSFLTTSTFGILELCNIIEALGYFLPSIYLPSYARSLGASGLLSTLTVVLFNVASVFGCVFMGAITDKLHVTTCIAISTIGSTIGVFAVWGLSVSMGPLYVFCIIYGLFAGSYTSTWPGVMRELKRKKESVDPTMVFACLAAGRGIGNVASGPLSEILIRGMPWKDQAGYAYGSGYGPLIAFTGVTALFGGASILGRRVGWNIYISLLALPLQCTAEYQAPRDSSASGHAPADRGTFESPSVHVRPKFRYWIPDASVDPAIVANDVQAAGVAGAAGVECLGYYLYGGPPANGGGRGSAAPVSWATYGFGTDAWNSLFKSLAQAHKDNGLIMDFAMGPNQGTGVPADINSDGLMWDLVIFDVSVPVGGDFNDTLPGWGTGSLEAAVTALEIKSESATSAAPGLPGDTAESRIQKTLAAKSLQDVTDRVDESGRLEIKFESGDSGLNYTLFAIYLIHSDYRAQDGPQDLGGPQTPAETLAQNGSWAVDHFSTLGAETTTSFWENYILQNGTRELLMEVGNYGWEDSVEITGNVYWTKNMLELFQADHGYSASKWLPILFHRNGLGADSNPPVWWITDEPDSGVGHIADFRHTLTGQYHKYLSTLNTWAEKYLGLQFSAQISYNLPMDMLSNIPAVGVPECESLDFSDLIDGYRQYSGPANIAGRNIVSSECGAVRGEAFAQTLPELMWKVKRSFAGSINQFVFHGFPYSGNYGNTTWPVFTTFDYQYSSMHGPHEPAWEFYRDQMDFVARNNYILQSGIPKRDVVFWQKITTYPGHITARTYDPTDLESAGYSYQYISPDNFDLQTVRVKDNVLAPDAQGFKAMVVRANDSLTVPGVRKLVEFAHAGLPIVFSGGIPHSYLGTNEDDVLTATQISLNSTATLQNVHVIDTYDGLASMLAAIGINPATSISTTGSWYTQQRSDPTTGIVYYYIYNDAMEATPGQGASNGTIVFDSIGTPYQLDAWTGEEKQLLTYTQSGATTTIPLNLAGNQSTIIAFYPTDSGKTDNGSLHLEYQSQTIIGTSRLDNGSIALQIGPGLQTPSYTLSNDESGTLPPVALKPTTIKDWTLIVEHWDPPSNLSNIEGGAVKHNTTHALPNLVSWQQISGLENVSGRGFYSAHFQWPLTTSSGMISGSADGVVIDFGPVVHTLRVSINGHPLSPLDVTSAKADIGRWLVQGTNKVEAVVATPLGNVLRTIWDQLETSGTGPSDPAGGGPPPPIANYGLLQDVVITPYRTIVIT